MAGEGSWGELAVLGVVGAAPGPPDLAGRVEVVLGCRIAHAFEGVAPRGEVLRAVGDELEFAGLDLGAVLLVLKVAEV